MNLRTTVITQILKQNSEQVETAGTKRTESPRHFPLIFGLSIFIHLVILKPYPTDVATLVGKIDCHLIDCLGIKLSNHDISRKKTTTTTS